MAWLSALNEIAAAPAEAFAKCLRAMFSSCPADRRDTWLRYASWLIAGLTFKFAAVITETAIKTGWEAVVRIAAMRIFLDHLLGRDLWEVRSWQQDAARP
jgi:uncharacterized membrane protein